MQKILIGALAVTTAILCIVCTAQWRWLSVHREREAAMQGALAQETQARETQTTKMRELEARADRLQREVQEFSSVTSNLRANESNQRSNVTALAEQVKASQKKAGAGGVSGKDMREMVSSMMKNPEMRKMLRGQQKSAVDMMYSGLFKQMQLAPEEKAEFAELLLDAQMRQVEGAQGVFSDSTDAAEGRRAMEQARKELDDQIKGLLGEERFAEYKEYQKNLGEQMQLNQLKTRLENDQMPLQEQQAAQLMQLMKDEKKRVPSVFPSDPNVSPAETKALMTSENLEKQFQWLDDYNKRVLEGAASFLSPEQLQKFREQQEQQASMQKMGLKMAKEMFGQQ